MGGDAERALSRFAKGFGTYKPGDFEKVLGLLESVGSSLMHLSRLAGLSELGGTKAAMAETTAFIRGLYRQGFGSAPWARSAIRARPRRHVRLGHLRMADLADGRHTEILVPDGQMGCTARKLRREDDLPICRVELLNLHGFLGWLEERSTGEGGSSNWTACAGDSGKPSKPERSPLHPWWCSRIRRNKRSFGGHSSSPTGYSSEGCGGATSGSSLVIPSAMNRSMHR